MSSAIDRLPEAEPPYPSPAPDRPETRPGVSTNLHQTLCWYPTYRSTGLELTESLAEAALRNNSQLPEEQQTAVRLKIRTDGAGIRFVKRLDEAGRWELCFTGIDPWLADIVEQVEPDDGAHHWHVTVANAGFAVAWTGTWDDLPAVPGLWIAKPWARVSLIP